jgi:hypothetical protein
MEFVTAWVSVPDLAVSTSAQRCTLARRHAHARVVRFESLGDSFAADLVFDEDGLIVD